MQDDSTIPHAPPPPSGQLAQKKSADAQSPAAGVQPVHALPGQTPVMLICPVRSPLYPGLLRGLSRYARTCAHWALYAETTEHRRLPELLAELKVRGVLCYGRAPAVAELVRHRRLVAVSLLAPWLPRLPVVRADDEAIGRMAAQHLLAGGFRRLAFCGYDRGSYGLRRYEGFAAEAASAGASVEAYFFDEPLDDRAEFARLSAWVASLPRPIGVLGANDLRARRVALACLGLGIAVPDEVSIVGVDDDERECALSAVPLSSVPLPTEAIAFRAAALLHERLSGRPWGRERLIRVPPAPLVVRRSSDAVAVEDEEVAVAARYIRDHVADPELTVARVVRAVNVSPRTLQLRFRKSLGRTVQQEIGRVRVERMKQLLAGTNLPLKQIAATLRLGAPRHAATAFRRAVGMTPSEYRARHRLA